MQKQPPNPGAYTRFGTGQPPSGQFGAVPGLLANTIRGALAAQGMMGNQQQIPSMQRQPFMSFGPYGLLAQQMAQQPPQMGGPQQFGGLLSPDGMPPSRIPYRPWGK